MESPSAAKRVFAIAELLEAILLQVDLEDKEQLGSYFSTPTARLFVLQRVSRAFQAVIHSSPPLRRLLCLELPASKSFHTAAAMVWLLRKRGWNVWPDQLSNGTLALGAQIDNPPRAYRHHQGFAEMSKTEASWRQMKVPPMIIQCLVFMKSESYYVEIDEESTLGEVWDYHSTQL